MISVADELCTAQSEPSMLTTFRDESRLKFVPVKVKRVPPAVPPRILPFELVTESTEAVKLASKLMSPTVVPDLVESLMTIEQRPPTD